MSGFKYLLLDIEGTIASISFVKEELFPYARENVESYLREHFNEPTTQKVVESLIELSAEESQKDSNITFVSPCRVVEDLSRHVRYWIDCDKKLTAMKELQGLIWEEAYKKGSVKGHLYADVVPALKRLNLPTFIYSSGSVKAQKLLFSHSVEGDITTLLSGYFDTKVGLKGDSSSYSAICNQIQANPAEVLFLSDVEAEVRAAKLAGLQTKLVVRPGNAPLSEAARSDFETIQSLSEL